MKNSGIEWIGAIPKGWNLVKAKFVISVSRGSDPKTEGKVPVYGSGSKCFKTCGEFKEGPCILLGRKGTLNVPHYITGKYWNVDTVFDVKAKNASLSLKYYYYLAFCFDYKLLKTETVVPSVTKSAYNNMKIPLPTINVQHQISDFLDEKTEEIDRAIGKIEKAVELYKKYRKALITETVTRGLNPGAEMKKSGIEWIDNIPSNWRVIPMKYLAVNENHAIVEGPFGSDMKNEDYLESGIPVIQLSNVKSYYHYIEKSNFISEEKWRQLLSNTVHSGDIAISKIIPGKACIIDASYDSYVVSSDVIGFRASIGVNRQFLVYCLNTYAMDECTLMSKGSANMRINLEILKNLKIGLPPKDEQDRIVSYLNQKCTAINKIVRELTRQATLLESYKKSLIYECVTGKRKIK